MGGETIDSKTLGKAIQQARQQAGLTQQQLCTAANLSYSTLAKIERGAIKTPSVFTVHRVAEVLGTSMDNLMGAVVHSGGAQTVVKKTSVSGVSFVYFDINGCLVRFFHSAFTRLSQETGVAADVIESTFWHYNDAVCRGEMIMSEFNAVLAKTVGREVDWREYYMQAAEPIEEMKILVSWAAQHYRIGLLSNIMPGFIDEMIVKGLLPKVHYESVVDSSVVHAIKPEEEIYRLAQQKAGVQPEEILFIDDSRANLMAAEHLGWKVLWFDSYRSTESIKRIETALEFSS
jgi:putative hydrolase of the HAD superfamily